MREREPAPPRPEDVGGLAASTFGTQDAATSLPAATPGSAQPPAATASLLSTLVPVTGDPPTPTETSPTPLTPSASETGSPEPSLLPSETPSPGESVSTSPSPSQSQGPAGSPRPTLAPGAGLGADTREPGRLQSTGRSKWPARHGAPSSTSAASSRSRSTSPRAACGAGTSHRCPNSIACSGVQGMIEVGGSRGGLMCAKCHPGFPVRRHLLGRQVVHRLDRGRCDNDLANGDGRRAPCRMRAGHADLSVECAVTGGGSETGVLVRTSTACRWPDFEGAPDRAVRSRRRLR